MLVAGTQPTVERQYFSGFPAASTQRPSDRILSIPNLSLAGQKHEHIAWCLALELLQRGDDALKDVAVLGGGIGIF